MRSSVKAGLARNGSSSSPLSLVVVAWLVMLPLLPAGLNPAAAELDPTFGEDGMVIDASLMGAQALVLQPDGKLAVATRLDSPDPGITLARFLADGSPDAAFGRNGQVSARLPFTLSPYHQLTGVSLALQEDGKLVVGPTLRPFGRRPDGVAGADFVLARFNADGSPDSAFGEDGWVRTTFGADESALGALLVLPDQTLVAAGTTWPEGRRDRFGLPAGAHALARYLPDGRLDPTFGQGGRVTVTLADSTGGEVWLVAQPDGMLVLAGWGGVLARFRPDGTLDPAFGEAGVVRCCSDGGGRAGTSRALTRQPDGMLVLAGEAGELAEHVALWRYDAAGRPDPAFGRGGTVLADFERHFVPVALAVEPDGGLLVAGIAATYMASEHLPFDFGLARFNDEGTLDGGFGTSGFLTTDFGAAWEGANALAIQPDGRLVVAGGGFGSFGLGRYRLGPRDPAAALPVECVDFIADVTIPDGTPMGPGEHFTKTWRLANCGAAEWTDYIAVRVAGAYGPPVIPLSTTLPLADVDVTAEMTAPLESGTHRATYRLVGPRGAFAGGFFIEIVVAP